MWGWFEAYGSLETVDGGGGSKPMGASDDGVGGRIEAYGCLRTW
jgi:hypothetical protein